MQRLSLLLLITASSAGISSDTLSADPYQIPADQLFAGAALNLLLPTGDFADTASVSPGITANGGYWALDSVALFASIQYFRLTAGEAIQGNPDLSLYSLGFGARWQPRISRRLQPFAELEFGLYTARVASAGLISSESAIGGRAGIGLSLAIRNSLTLEPLVSLSRSEFEESGIVSGITFSLGLTTRL